MKMKYDIPLHTLTKKELEILRYVHDNSALIQTMSIQQFTKNINYSTSTVLRFCRKLGFSGYPELKYYLKNKVTEGIAADSRQIDVTAYTKIKQNIRFVKGAKKITTSVPEQKVTIVYNGSKSTYNDFVKVFAKIGYDIKVIGAADGRKP